MIMLPVNVQILLKSIECKSGPPIAIAIHTSHVLSQHKWRAS